MAIYRQIANNFVQIHDNFFSSWDKNYFFIFNNNVTLHDFVRCYRQPIDIVGAYLRQCLKQHAM
jgi:hypothetical protein